MRREGEVEGKFDEMTQDRRGVGQETCQHCGRPVPLLINISIFKVTLLLLWKQKREVSCIDFCFVTNDLC